MATLRRGSSAEVENSSGVHSVIPRTSGGGGMGLWGVKVMLLPWIRRDWSKVTQHIFVSTY